MDRILLDYRVHQQRRNLSRDHVQDTQRGLERLADALVPADFASATSEAIEEWLDTLDLEASARYNWVSRIRTFYRWANDRGVFAHDPSRELAAPKVPRRLPSPIGDEDLVWALEQADPLMRDRLTLAAFAGLRCMEIAGLHASSYDAHRALLQVFGKGGHERVIPVHPRVALVLDRGPRTGAIFTQPNGDTWTKEQVSSRIWEYLHGIEVNASAHQLRHWFGTRTYEACRDLRVVQELMGHASPATTAKYAAHCAATASGAVAALCLAGELPGGEAGRQRILQRVRLLPQSALDSLAFVLDGIEREVGRPSGVAMEPGLAAGSSTALD